MSRHRSIADPLMEGESSLNEEIDPMSSMANLADIMLVFACGLMLALIAYWNIDMPTITEITQTDMTQFVDEPENNDATVSDDEGFQDVGRVYRDPETGKMYILEEDLDASES